MTQPAGNVRLMTDHTGAPSTVRLFAPLAIILGIPLIFAALFFYTSPVVLETGGPQGIFKCGSPSSPNTDAKNVCNDPESIARNKAIYSGLAGVSLLGLGLVWLLRGQGDDEVFTDDEFGPRRHDDGDSRAGDRDRHPRGRDDALATDVDEGHRPPVRGRERRSVLRDDDFADPDARRRTDDDWSADGWR